MEMGHKKDLTLNIFGLSQIYALTQELNLNLKGAGLESELWAVLRVVGFLYHLSLRKS